MTSFPLYLLKLGDNWQVVFPEDKADVGHTDFWEQTVSKLVAKHFNIPASRVANLPYCQRRARVVGDMVYYGGKPAPFLLRLIRQSLRNKKLVFVHDDHERRLREDVREFSRLVERYRVTGQNRQ